MSSGSLAGGAAARVRSGWTRVSDKLRTRGGAAVAGLLALVLVAGGAAAVEPLTGKSLGQVLAADAEGVAADVPCDEPAADLPAAWDRAKACGHEIESLADRTEYTTAYGTVDELVREEISAAAVRSRTADGGWTDVDTSIVPGEDGRLEVAAPGLAEISFADPGAAGADPDAPLAVLERDGHELEFDVPFELTEPVVEGDRVRYPALFGDPGIELTVRPNGDGTGIREVITVDDAESAANPGLVELDFRVEVSGGLRLAAESGGFVAEDEAGEQVFRAPQPTGWTAEGHEPVQEVPTTSQVAGMAATTTMTTTTTGPADVAPADVVDGPGSYGAIFEMDTDVQVDGTGNRRSATVSVRPDQAVLTDRDTTYPVALDPSVSGSLNEFTAVKSYWPSSTSGYGFGDTSDGTHGIGLCNAADPYGYECMGATSRHRIMYEFNGLSKIKYAEAGDVQSATLDVYGTHSYNCTTYNVAAYQLGSISSSTNWNNMPTWTTENRQDSVGVAHKLGECGGRKWVGFNVTQAMKNLAANNWTTMTFGLKVDESSMLHWKRYSGDRMKYNGTWYDRAPKLSVTYNRPPNAPTGQQTWSIDPSKDHGCKASSTPAWVPAVRPRFKAKGTDPDGQSVKVRFVVQKVSTGSTVWSAWTSLQSSGKVHTARPSDASQLAQNVKYRWRAQAKDSGGRAGPVSGWCYFYADIDKPNPPWIEAATDKGADADYPDCSPGSTECAEAGGVGQTGKFRFGFNGSGDVARFQWSWDNESFSQSHVPWSSDTYVTSYTPPTPGPHMLYARSVDRAGNVSDRATYKIDVASPLADGRWPMDEGPESDYAYDKSLAEVKHDLTLSSSGATWLEGPHEAFDSREGDYALRFAGAGDAVADGPVVDTLESFVVSAFVLPSNVGPDTGTQVAVAQEGTNGSGFMLTTRSCTKTSNGVCWAFSMYDVDGSGPTRAVSEVPVEQGRWTHLLAEHDAVTDNIRMWVCPIGMPHDQLPGEPVATDDVTFTSSWQAIDPFVVGRGRWGGADFGHWYGRVDDVRVWDGEVVAEAKIRRLCQGAGGDDFAGDVALDPTLRIDIGE
ncbi:hypothetical protein GCM10027059_49080 [Myceligenerans halotolerans]